MNRIITSPLKVIVETICQYSLTVVNFIQPHRLAVKSGYNDRSCIICLYCVVVVMEHGSHDSGDIAIVIVTKHHPRVQFLAIDHEKNSSGDLTTRNTFTGRVNNRFRTSVIEVQRWLRIQFGMQSQQKRKIIHQLLLGNKRYQMPVGTKTESPIQMRNRVIQMFIIHMEIGLQYTAVICTKYIPRHRLRE